MHFFLPNAFIFAQKQNKRQLSPCGTNPNVSQNEILVFWLALRSFTLGGGCRTLVCRETAPGGFSAAAPLREGCLVVCDYPHPQKSFFAKPPTETWWKDNNNWTMLLAQAQTGIPSQNRCFCLMGDQTQLFHLVSCCLTWWISSIRREKYNIFLNFSLYAAAAHHAAQPVGDAKPRCKHHRAPSPA